MTWVKRDPPGDAEYCCECPPCPFCFVWVAEPRKRRPRRKKKEIEREPSSALRFVPLGLTGAAFVLTVAITMKHPGWPHAAQNTPRSAAAPAIPLMQRRLPAFGLARNESQVAAPASAPAAEAATPTAPVAAPTSPVSPDEQPSALVPVSFRFATETSGLSVSVRNMSMKPQDLTVTAVEPSSGSQTTVQVKIPGHATTNLTEAGLVAEPGYRLSVDSEGYLTRSGIVVP
jgi:hypothetical protein